MRSFDIKWISTMLFIFGGTSIALKLPWIKYAFPCFVIAHTILIFNLYKYYRNTALIFQNIYFLTVNTIATFLWFKG
jgi:hypothetical protein